MAGLLDLDPSYGLTGGGLMDPRTQGLLGLSSALMAAGGPQRTPVSFGQALGQGLQGGMQAYGQARQGQMQELQGAMLIAKLKKEMEAQKAFSDMYGPTAQKPVQVADASGPGMSPSTSQYAFGSPDFASIPQKPSQPAQKGPGLDQIGRLMGLDPERGKAALELWKAQNPGLEFKDGYAFDKQTGQPVTQLPQTLVTPQGQAVGLTPGLNGGPASVSALPGSLDTFRSFQDAQEAAKAGRDIVTVMVNGRPTQMTREAAAQSLTPQQPPQTPPLPVAAQVANTQFPRETPEQRNAAAQKRLEILNAERADQAKNGSVDPGLEREIKREKDRLGVGQDLTPAEKRFAEGSAENAVKYRASINERVSTGQDLMMRIGESENLLKDFKAGGGEGVRVQLAQTAQALGAPQSVVDGITRGDLGSAQAFQKIVVSQAMEALKQSMATTGGTGAGRITQAEFQIFQKANPNLELDPRALEKIYGFAKKVHARDFSEQQAFQGWVDQGNDPASFQADWAKRMEKKPNLVKEVTSSTGDKSLPPGVRVTKIK